MKPIRKLLYSYKENKQQNEKADWEKILASRTSAKRVMWKWKFSCNPMDCGLPGSSVHGILQARILERVASPFSRGSSWPRNQTRSPALQADSLPSEPPGKLWNWWPMKREASGISKSPREGRMRYELDPSRPQQPYDLGGVVFLILLMRQTEAQSMYWLPLDHTASE